MKDCGASWMTLTMSDIILKERAYLTGEGKSITSMISMNG